MTTFDNALMLAGISVVLLGLIILNLTVSTPRSSLHSWGSRMVWGGGALMWASALSAAFL